MVFKLRPIKIYAISDLHGNKRKFEFAAKVLQDEKPDLLIICGDISHSSRAKRLEHMISFLKFDPILYVLGNMDGQDVTTEVSNAKNIHLSFHKINDYKIYGIGGPDVGLNDLVENSKEKFSDVDPKKLILVSHIPPKNHQDLVYRGENVGNRALCNLIEEIQPKILLCGHIHEDRGHCKLNNSIIINVGPSGYIIEIDEKNISYRSIDP